jgi:hypothetical protein
MKIVEVVRNVIYKCNDLVSGKLTDFHFDRLRIVNVIDEMVREADLVVLATNDKDEFVVEKILSHRGNPKRKATLEFLIRWKGYDESEDTWLRFPDIKELELAALDIYLEENGELLAKNFELNDF